MSLFSSVLLLLVQIPAILLITMLCGDLLERFRQPRVVGEILGGLLLGPLALGRLSPAAYTFLFPPGQLQPLETVGRIGLILFLFLIGSELDLGALRKNSASLFAILFGSVYLPFAFGASLAPELRIHFGFPETRPIVFLLFIGIAMSITALPVLARIIQDRKGSARPVDTFIAATSLASAAANDLLAWLLLAMALALTRDSGSPLLSRTVALHLLLLVFFIAAMLFVVRPLAKLLLTEGVSTWALVVASIPFAVLSGQISEALGVHAFFGAFLAGLCFPLRHNAWLQLEHALSPIVRTTLPVFFALTGLSMDPAMLRLGNFGWLALLLLAAVAGKLGGATLSARASGMPWRPAAQIGALLNTRGLVELIVLNIGFQQHILTPALYTLFVFVALLTTAMTSPLLDLLTPAYGARSSSS
jgi:Kef-type K+ transport system membrane component KefB